MSYNEMENPSYGFSKSKIACKALSTDYAKAQGCVVYPEENEFKGSTAWLLRTPGLTSETVDYVDTVGFYTYTVRTYSAYVAIRPALCLNSISSLGLVVSSEGSTEYENTENNSPNGENTSSEDGEESKSGSKDSKKNSEKSKNDTILYAVIGVGAVAVIALAILLIKKAKTSKKSTNARQNIVEQVYCPYCGNIKNKSDLICPYCGGKTN